jgi:hypothetical protein
MGVRQDTFQLGADILFILRGLRHPNRFVIAAGNTIRHTCSPQPKVDCNYTSVMSKGDKRMVSVHEEYAVEGRRTALVKKGRPLRRISKGTLW